MHARALLAGALAAGLSLAAQAGPQSPARRTAVVAAVDRTRAAVVNINAQEVVKARAAEDPFDAFFGRFRRQDEVRNSLGSGFVFDAAGYVLTNYHVVARGSRIQVSFEDGTDYVAKVVGTDPGGDLAVLKIRGERKFPTAPLGTSTDLMLGEPTIAIGNPFGLNQSVSLGVVSALHRSVHAEDRSYYDFIQTDASINPGNSGGPLLNGDGEVVGVCSAIYANAQGIGFAIPIDRALRVARELVKSGELASSFWGFDGTTPDPKNGGKPGALVTGVETDSPAAKAGLRKGDLVVRLDQSPVRDADELRFLLRDVPVGSRVTLGVMRGAWGWTLLSLVWSMALLGVLLKAIGGLRYRRLSICLYLAMGWLALIAARTIWLHVPVFGLAWLLAGGLAYTAGVAFYALERLRYNHLIWHMFVLTGSICHLCAVLWYST